MRIFRGYASRASAGILADDPQNPAWSRTDAAGEARDPRRRAFSAGADGLADGGELPPVQAPAQSPGARLREALLPRLSLRALALALLLNVLLALGFARLAEQDILSLPKPVFWIQLAGPAGHAGSADHAGHAARTGAAPSGGAARAPAVSAAARAGAFARRAAPRGAGPERKR